MRPAFVRKNDTPWARLKKFHAESDFVTIKINKAIVVFLRAPPQKVAQI